MFVYTFALCSDLKHTPSRVIVVFVRVVDGGDGVLGCAESRLLAFLLSHRIRRVELAALLGDVGECVVCSASLPPRCLVAP